MATQVSGYAVLVGSEAVSVLLDMQLGAGAGMISSMLAVWSW
jgi:hypothetical protein